MNLARGGANTHNYQQLGEYRQLIVMARKTFVPLIEVLNLIDEKEVVGRIDLVDNLAMTYMAAAQRLFRLSKAGLLEPLGSEKGRWTLSVRGGNHLDYLRRTGNVKRR